MYNASRPHWVTASLIHINIDDRTFNDLLTTKRALYQPSYPYRTKPEFVPKDNPLRSVMSTSAFLNLVCEKKSIRKNQQVVYFDSDDG